MTINPLYSVAGVLVGLLVGLTGVGGGSLMTPILVLLFRFHPVTAVGTDLLYASATKFVGAGVHGAKGGVDWRIVFRLARGSVPAVLLTLAVLALIHARPDALNEAISGVLGGVLVVAGIATFFRRRLTKWLQAHFAEHNETRIAWWTTLLGFTLGALITLTSVGAGALGMTALLVLYPRAPIARLVGSDIAHAVPLTLLAGLGHWAMGSVDLSLLVSLLIGSIPGIIAGSLLASHVPERVLGPILAATLVVAGGRLMMPDTGHAQPRGAALAGPAR